MILLRTIRRLCVLGAMLLQGCFPVLPHVQYAQHDTGYALPQAAPFLVLDNGLTIHGWHDCYGFVLRDEPCEPLTLIALPTGSEPDWNSLWKVSSSLGLVTIGENFERPFSAFRNTDYRLLGASTKSIGQHDLEIYLIKPADRESHAEIRTFDIWHNDNCSAGNHPRLVLFDEQRLWIFADADPSCPRNPNDLFIPRDIASFNRTGNAEFQALLERPMKLFYLDSASRDKSDYGDPRLVVRDGALHDGVKRRKVSSGEVERPG